MIRYTKLCGLVMVTGLLLGLAVPAKASAPLLGKRVLVRLSAISHPKAYANNFLKLEGYDLNQYPCLVKLWKHESHWNYRAKNPNSSAFGIGQLLIETSKDPATQIRDGIRYIGYRYGSPCVAELFWENHFWY